MPSYMNYFNNRRRGPKFKPGDMVYDGEKFVVESSEWSSLNGETTYIIRNAWGTQFCKKESELMSASAAVVADRYKYCLQLSNLMGIKKVIFNAPATIVLWNDGTKTVVKCSEGDIFDPEKGLAFCFLKKLLGDRYYKIINSEACKYDGGESL